MTALLTAQLEKNTLSHRVFFFPSIGTNLASKHPRESGTVGAEISNQYVVSKSTEILLVDLWTRICVVDSIM